MSLFGRRHHNRKKDNLHAHPTLYPETLMRDALLFATGISLLAGLSEEIIFRVFIPAAVYHQSQSQLLALFSQALLFGHLHVTPQASRGENRIMCGVQILHGLWFGIWYLLFGGDVFPCILAHALYDLHVFMKTWVQVNNQMDYTEEVVLQKLSPGDEEAIRLIKEEAGPTLTIETLAFARRFFHAFDYEHRGSLSENDVQRAVSYAFLQDKIQPSQNRVSSLFQKILRRRVQRPGTMAKAKQEDRLELPEFLRLLFLLRGNPYP